MKKSKIFAALALSACMALGATGLIACSPNNGGNNGNGNSGYTQETDDPIMKVYKAYVTSAQANGEEPLSYEEWYADLLANAKGETGDKGDKGDKGEDGAAGKDGNTWLVGQTAPTAEDGNDGDLYLDYTTWNVYHKQSGEWVLLGNIKGADGEGGSQGGEQGEDENIVKNFGTITIQAGETYDLSFEDVENGTYTLSAEIESGEVVQSGLTATTAFLNASTGAPLGNPYTYDMYSPLGNTYKSVHIIDNSKATVSKTTVLNNNTEAEITVKVALKEYVAPEIKLGEEIEVPFINNTIGYVPVAIPSMAGNTYNITFKNFKSTGTPTIRDLSGGQIAATFIESDGIFTKTGVTLTTGLDFVCFVDGQSRHCCNAIVLFEAVEE